MLVSVSVHCQGFYGRLGWGGGRGKVIQGWDAKQAASRLLFFMPGLICRCDRQFLLHRINGALEMMTQSF